MKNFNFLNSLLLAVFIILSTATLEAQKDIKKVLSFGISHTASVRMDHNIQLNHYKIIPQLEARLGTRSIRGLASVGPDLKVGVEFGRFVTFNLAGGWNIRLARPTLETSVGARIVLNKKGRMVMDIKTGGGILLKKHPNDNTFIKTHWDINGIIFSVHYNIAKK